MISGLKNEIKNLKGKKGNKKHDSLFKFFFKPINVFNSVLEAFKLFVHPFLNLIEYLEMAYTRGEGFLMLRYL